MSFSAEARALARRAALQMRTFCHMRAALGRGWRFLTRLLRASPAAVALLVILCAAGLLVLVSFAFMMLPASRIFALRSEIHGLSHEPPGGRALYFFICLISAWVAGLAMKALDAWWERFRRPEQAALNLPAGLNNNLRAWLRRTARTAAKLYDISFWIMAAAVGSLMLMRAARDPAFVPTVNRLTSLLADYFGAAGGTIMLETSRLPPAFGLPAGLLFISFFFFGCWKLMRSGGK